MEQPAQLSGRLTTESGLPLADRSVHGLRVVGRAALAQGHDAVVRRRADPAGRQGVGGVRPVPRGDRGHDAGHGAVRAPRSRGVRRHGGRHGLAGRRLRRDLARLDGGGRHYRQPFAVLLDDRPVRDAGAEARASASARQRRAPDRNRADRARRWQRPAGHRHDRAPGRGSLRRQRPQDMDHQRQARRPAAGPREDRPVGPARAQGHVRAPRGSRLGRF